MPWKVEASLNFTRLNVYMYIDDIQQGSPISFPQGPKLCLGYQAEGHNIAGDDSGVPATPATVCRCQVKILYVQNRSFLNL